MGLHCLPMHFVLKVQNPVVQNQQHPGLSHPFLGMGPGPLELGKIASF